MTYAIISDLHANLEALEAVLDDAKPYADTFICLGDIVGYNANPLECLSLVRELCTVVISGNHDQAACDVRPYDDFSENARLAMDWTRAQLTPEWKEYLRNLPLSAPFAKDCLAAHGSPRDTDEYLFHAMQFRDSFAHLISWEPQTHTCFIGHTHLPMVWQCTADGLVSPAEPQTLTFTLDPAYRYLINPGSVGQPRYGDPAPSYVLFDDEKRTVEFRFVTYDIQTTQEKIYDAGLPVPLAERLALGQ